MVKLNFVISFINAPLKTGSGGLMTRNSLHGLLTSFFLFGSPTLGSIQPLLHQSNGASFPLTGGSQLIFDKTLTEPQFVATTYAIDCQSPNQMSWTLNEPNSRPLYLGTNNTQADGSVTWKFVAPPNSKFTGGTLALTGTTVWVGAKISLQAHSTYSTNNGGIGGYSGIPSTLYDEDTHAPDAPWTWSDWVVEIPQNVAEFYVTVAIRQDYKEAWIQKLKAYGVTTTSLAPIVAPTTPNTLPAGWTLSKPSGLIVDVSAKSFPTALILLNIKGPVQTDQWALYGSAPFNVNQGETWTFTAVVGGNDVGMMHQTGNGALGIVYLDANGNVVNWDPAHSSFRGSLPWTCKSVSVTVPYGVAKLWPRFYGYGGGEFFVSSANFAKVPTAAPLIAMPTPLSFNASFKDSVHTLVTRSNYPFPHWQFKAGNASNWEFGPQEWYPVQPGQTWIFQVVLSNRNVGWMTNKNGQMWVYGNGATTELAWNSAKSVVGTHGWDSYTFSYAVPNPLPTGMTAIRPKIFIYGGGGEVYVASCSFKLEGDHVNLPVPSEIIPPLKAFDFELPIASVGQNALYIPGSAISWFVAKDAIYNDITLPFSVKNAYGAILPSTSGIVDVFHKATFTPNVAWDGYFELNLNAWVDIHELRGNASIKQSSAASIADPFTPVSSRTNPFGLSDGVTMEEIRRFGMSFMRPNRYNIVTGSHTDLPSSLNPTGYQTAWMDSVNASPPQSTFNINAIEIWNEPYNEIKCNADSLWGKCPTTTESDNTMTQFKTMLSSTRTGISNSLYPGIQIAVNTDGDNVSFFNSLDVFGGRPFYDIATLHPYSKCIFGCSEHNSAGPEKDALLDYLQHTIAENINYAPSLGTKKIWSTEFGWPTSSRLSWRASELNQARYIVRSAILQLSSGLEKVVPFRLDDEPSWPIVDGSMGFRRADVDKSPKPSLVAYSVLAQTIDNLTYRGRINFNLGNLAAFLFGLSDRCILVLWNPDGNTSLTIPMPSTASSDPVHITGINEIGMLGGKSPITSSSFTETFGKSPVYIEFRSNGCVPEAWTLVGSFGGTFTAGVPTNFFQNVQDDPKGP